jgi:protocatechuate 3,4-dioxygenase, alpha subunit
MTDQLDPTRLGTTPSQTVGPYLAIGLPWPDGPDVVADGTPGSFVIGGVLRDGAGDPVSDGLVEIWQADPDGRFAHPDDPRGPVERPGFRGFGRCATDGAGRFWFRTVKPGPLPAEDGRTEAPHLTVSVFARGVVQRLVTRIYFPDEADANAADPLLDTLPESDRDRLTARPGGGTDLRFDIGLQGDGETPFFEI